MKRMQAWSAVAKAGCRHTQIENFSTRATKLSTIRSSEVSATRVRSACHHEVNTAACSYCPGDVQVGLTAHPYSVNLVCSGPAPSVANERRQPFLSNRLRLGNAERHDATVNLHPAILTVANARKRGARSILPCERAHHTPVNLEAIRSISPAISTSCIRTGTT